MRFPRAPLTIPKIRMRLTSHCVTTELRGQLRVVSLRELELTEMSYPSTIRHSVPWF
jgi:hypothetical protein